MNVWRYSSSEHVWYITTELLRPRRHHAVCASKKELFLIGGFGEFRMQLKSVDKYNTETGTFFFINFILPLLYLEACFGCSQQ